ncbi:Arm DNA-binding domain-containing protein, partial [Alistipes putredinis]
MKQTDVTVTFYLKKSEMNDEGHCPVMAKLAVGKFSEAAFSAKMSVPVALWASGRATGKSNAAREINRQLDDLRASAISIYDELSATRENVTAE